MRSISPRLEVARDAAWFRVGEQEVALEGRAVLRSVLRALVEQRVRAPGSPLTGEVLSSKAWPGQHVRTEGAHHRLFVAMRALHDMGLRPVIERRAKGYLISPRVDVVLVA